MAFSFKNNQHVTKYIITGLVITAVIMLLTDTKDKYASTEGLTVETDGKNKQLSKEQVEEQNTKLQNIIHKYKKTIDPKNLNCELLTTKLDDALQNLKDVIKANPDAEYALCTDDKSQFSRKYKDIKDKIEQHFYEQSRHEHRKDPNKDEDIQDRLEELAGNLEMITILTKSRSCINGKIKMDQLEKIVYGLIDNSCIGYNNEKDSFSSEPNVEYVVKEISDKRKQIFKSIDGVLYDTDNDMSESEFKKWQLLGNSISLANFLSRKYISDQLGEKHSNIQHSRGTINWNASKTPSKARDLIEQEKPEVPDGCLRDSNDIIRCENPLNSASTTYGSYTMWEYPSSKIARKEHSYHFPKMKTNFKQAGELFKKHLTDHR